MPKILWTLGTIAVTLTPIALVVACINNKNAKQQGEYSRPNATVAHKIALKTIVEAIDNTILVVSNTKKASSITKQEFLTALKTWIENSSQSLAYKLILKTLILNEDITLEANDVEGILKIHIQIEDAGYDINQTIEQSGYKQTSTSS